MIKQILLVKFPSTMESETITRILEEYQNTVYKVLYDNNFIFIPVVSATVKDIEFEILKNPNT